MLVRWPDDTGQPAGQFQIARRRRYRSVERRHLVDERAKAAQSPLALGKHPLELGLRALADVVDPEVTSFTARSSAILLVVSGLA
jgi:hypothetical protein